MLHTFAFKKSLVFFFSKAHLQHKTSILYQSEGGKRGLMSCLLRLTCLFDGVLANNKSPLTALTVPNTAHSSLGPLECLKMKL